MEQRNQRNTKRRLNSLILLVAFTAIMLIVSTYAWFSMNKEVSITNLEGTVNVVEGLEISLDADNWETTLNLTGVDLTSTYTENTNIHPTELLPVSTTGVAASDATDLTMYRGTNEGTAELKNIKATVATGTNATDNPDTYPGYFAFDLFVRNSSKTGTADVLQLNEDSLLALKDSAKSVTGLQNAVRVGIAKYTGAVDIDPSNNSGSTVRTALKSATIADVAIWEPNADAHIANVIKDNNEIRIDEAATTGWDFTEKDKTNLIYTFGASSKIPTYALTSTANNSSISNIYDWATSTKVGGDAGKVAIQQTLKTVVSDIDADGTLKNVYNLKSTSNGTADFKIEPNKITKLRIFVWLEGQDVDCTNYASHGGGIKLNLGFAKGQTAANT